MEIAVSVTIAQIGIYAKSVVSRVSAKDVVIAHHLFARSVKTQAAGVFALGVDTAALRVVSIVMNDAKKPYQCALRVV